LQIDNFFNPIPQNFAFYVILAKISINLKTVFLKIIPYFNISNFCAKCKEIFEKNLKFQYFNAFRELIFFNIKNDAQFYLSL
jgi:hypothetical protein